MGSGGGRRRRRTPRPRSDRRRRRPPSATAPTASEMTRAVWRIASAVDTACIGLPAKRAGSTWMSAAMITASAATMVGRIEPLGGAAGTLRLDVDVVSHHLGLALQRLGRHEGVGDPRRARGHGDEPHVVSSSFVRPASPELLDLDRSDVSLDPLRRRGRVPTCDTATAEQAVARPAASASGSPRSSGGDRAGDHRVAGADRAHHVDIAADGPRPHRRR